MNKGLFYFFIYPDELTGSIFFLPRKGFLNNELIPCRTPEQNNI